MLLFEKKIEHFGIPICFSFSEQAGIQDAHTSNKKLYTSNAFQNTGRFQKVEQNSCPYT